MLIFFYNSGIRIWNSRPDSITNANSVNSFKILIIFGKNQNIEYNWKDDLTVLVIFYFLCLIFCGYRGRFSLSPHSSLSCFVSWLLCGRPVRRITRPVRPSTRPALTPANQAGTRFTYPGWMGGWVDLGSMIAARLGIEPTTAWSQVQRPKRYAIKPRLLDKPAVR